MKNGREYWNLKIEETKELFAKRPVWMENFDNDFPSAAFIKGLISDYKPENMLEVGTAAGWAAYYMLEEALKYRKNVKLTSIDIAEFIYYSTGRKVGSAFFETAPELVKYWDLRTKITLIDYVSEYKGKKFDFAFIDAEHFHPWATFDLLAALPCMVESAIIVFHDVFLNIIENGQLPSDRHPYCISGKREKYWGPNSLYEAFKEKMCLSYDDIAPNCAAIRLSDLTFDKILSALGRPWEKEIWQNTSTKDLLILVQKLEKFVKIFWGENEAADFMQLCQKRIEEDGENAQRFYAKQHKQRTALLREIIKDKKTVLWGASRFLQKLLLENEIERANITGIIDMNPSLQGKSIGGLMIYPPDRIKELNPQQICSTVVTTPGMKNKIKEILHRNSIFDNFEINEDLFECFQNFED